MRVTAQAPLKDIGALTGMHAATVRRWKTETQPSADAAVALARAYNRSPVEALIVARYLDEADVSTPIQQAPALNEVPDEVLLAELKRRLKELNGRLKKLG